MRSREEEEEVDVMGNRLMYEVEELGAGGGVRLSDLFIELTDQKLVFDC